MCCARAGRIAIPTHRSGRELRSLLTMTAPDGATGGLPTYLGTSGRRRRGKLPTYLERANVENYLV